MIYNKIHLISPGCPQQNHVLKHHSFHLLPPARAPTRCEAIDETEEGDTCVLITDCSIPRCVNGFCIVVDDQWVCDCYDSYEGLVCDQEPQVAGVVAATLGTGGIAAIVICLIALLSKYLLGYFIF